jgi:acyl dehydratase
MYYLKDYWTGKIHASHEPYRVTEEEIIEVGRRWDPRPFHIDPVAAAQLPFGGVIACSAHLFCILSWLSHHMEDDTAAVAGLGCNNVKMHAPVCPDDKISLKAKCLESRPSKTQPGVGIVTVQNNLFNQRSEKVFTAEVSFLLKCRPE